MSIENKSGILYDGHLYDIEDSWIYSQADEQLGRVVQDEMNEKFVILDLNDETVAVLHEYDPRVVVGVLVNHAI